MSSEPSSTEMQGEEQAACAEQGSECQQAADVQFQPHEYRKVTEYNCGVNAWNDHVRELQGCDYSKISNCWNCNYPLTIDGYFPSIKIDWTDPANDCLLQARKRLQELLPLPSQTFGCPVHRSADCIEAIGSFHSIACVKRYAHDTLRNQSDIDLMVTVLAREAGVKVDTLHTAPPANTLLHRGGIFTYAEYEHPDVAQATPVSRLMRRNPQHIQVVEKGGTACIISPYEAYLKERKERSSIQPNETQDPSTSTNVLDVVGKVDVSNV